MKQRERERVLTESEECERENKTLTWVYLPIIYAGNDFKSGPGG